MMFVKSLGEVHVEVSDKPNAERRNNQVHAKSAVTQISGVPKTDKNDGGLRSNKVQDNGGAPLRSGVPKPKKYDRGLGPEKADLSKVVDIKMENQPKRPVSNANKSNGQELVPNGKAETSELGETITGEQLKVVSQEVVGVGGTSEKKGVRLRLK